MLATGWTVVLGPELLLVDEPSAGLAPELVGPVFENIEKVRDRRIAVLMIE